MKKITILILLSLISIYTFGQRDPKLKYDTKVIEGTWVATSSNKSYEITFIRTTRYVDLLKKDYEVILGSVKYLENNKVIRTVAINESEFPLSASSISNSPKEFSILYFESYKRLTGHAKFDISIDGKTACWHSLQKTESWGKQQGDFDMPKELTFKKK
ncbi:MAG: DUF6705 family protein [Dysgonomonas sp.]